MSDFRKLAHLQEQLGEERFQALLDPANTGKVKQFCDELPLPTEITLGHYTYELLSVLRDDEDMVNGDTVVERAAEMSANTGIDDARKLFRNQSSIPKRLRGRVMIAFPDWHNPFNCREVYCYRWVGGRWKDEAHSLDDDWYPSTLVLRRKS